MFAGQRESRSRSLNLHQLKFERVSMQVLKIEQEQNLSKKRKLAVPTLKARSMQVDRPCRKAHLCFIEVSLPVLFIAG